jgi:hypothetical protein
MVRTFAIAAVLMALVAMTAAVPGPASVTAAPNAQATATPTSTSTPTSTPTATPTRPADSPIFGMNGDPPVDFCTRPVGDGTYGLCVQDVRGAYTNPVLVVATVGATPGPAVVAANPNRAYLYCANDSAVSPIYIMTGSTPTVGHGIRLNTSGGVYEMSAPAGNLYQGAVYAVATQTTSSLICVEGRN